MKFKEMDGVLEITKEYYDNAVMDNPDAIVLIDTGGPDAPGDFKHAGFALVTASPAAIPKEMKKQWHCSLAYLPVWTKGEVDCAFKKFPDEDRQNMNLYLNGQKELDERYAFAGGVPRILFGEQDSVNEYEKDTDTAISSATENIKPHISLRENVHKVFHIYAGDTLATYKFKYASKEIGEKFEELLKRLNSDKIKILLSGLVEGNVRLSALQSGVGVLYEGTIHGMLASSFYHYRLNIRWRDSEPRNSLTFGELKENRSLKLFSVAGINHYQLNTYYVPDRANQPVIDSWTKFGNELYFFQITKKKTRTFGAKEYNFFQNIRKEQKDIRIRFIYVVPSVIEKDFKIPGKQEENVNVSMGLLGVDVMESELSTTLTKQFRAWELLEEDETGQAPEPEPTVLQ